MWYDEYVPTTVGRAEPHNLALIHPTQARVLTIRENARTQVRYRSLHVSVQSVEAGPNCSRQRECRLTAFPAQSTLLAAFIVLIRLGSGNLPLLQHRTVMQGSWSPLVTPAWLMSRQATKRQSPPLHVHWIEQLLAAGIPRLPCSGRSDFRWVNPAAHRLLAGSC